MGAMLSALAIAAMFALFVREYWLRLFETESTARRQFLLWACKGLVIPILVWVFINCGFVPGMPVFLPEIAIAKSRGGGWIRLLARSCAPVLMITSSYWAAITVGWLQALVAGRAQDRRELRVQVVFWGALLLPVAAVAFHLLGPGGLGLALLLW